jgi:peroxiredoxin
MRTLLFLCLLLTLGACADTGTPVTPTVVRVGTALGDLAPDFTLLDTSGNPLTLSQLRGKVVLLDFWASWCIPCRVQLPDFRTVQEKYRDRGFIIVGISSDFSIEAWKEYIRSEDLDWLHVYDSKDSLSPYIRYDVTGIPRTWLLDRDGFVVRSGLHGNQLDTAVAAVLQE